MPGSTVIENFYDFFCGIGGCSVGADLAFRKVCPDKVKIQGFDNNPVPLRQYPFDFEKVDVMEKILDMGPAKFLNQNAIFHFSPPCQLFSLATPAANRKNHVDLFNPVREFLNSLPVSSSIYIVENVTQAWIKSNIDIRRLEKSFVIRVFGYQVGLPILMERWFEIWTGTNLNPFMILNPNDCSGHTVMNGKRVEVSGKPKVKKFSSKNGGHYGLEYELIKKTGCTACEINSVAKGIDWIKPGPYGSGECISQLVPYVNNAIPPKMYCLVIEELIKNLKR
jgi:hypothetical protein